MVSFCSFSFILFYYSSAKVCTTTTTMYFKQGVHSGKECAKRDIVFCLGLCI